MPLPASALPLPPAPGNHLPAFCHESLDCLRISCKWNYIVDNFLWLISFIQSFWDSHVAGIKGSFLFIFEPYFIVCMHHNWLIYLLVDIGFLSIFQLFWIKLLWTFMNKTLFSFLGDTYLRVKLLGCIICTCLTLYETTVLLSIPTMRESSGYSTFSPTLGIVSLFTC